jgi:gliding motility-associated-like protein
MSRSLVLSFQSASKKYSRLNKQIQKSISRGEFWRFTTRKRNHLIHKIDRLKRRLAELKTQIRFAAVGVTAGLMMMATDGQAQSTSTNPLGPFIKNRFENPLPPPAFANFDFATITYADLDGDGDLDATISSENHDITYYENNGTAGDALFDAWNFEQVAHPWPFENISLHGTYQNRTRIAYADVDDDGDMDFLAGQDYTDLDPGNPDHLFFYRNDAGPGAKPHFVEPLEEDPFRDIGFDGSAWPVFADVDSDGDQDLIVAGRYFDASLDEFAWIQFYRNDKVGHAPDVDPVYVQVSGEDNPFYLNDSDVSDYLAPAFVDMDEDGDMDFIYASGDGVIHYKRNDNGTLVEQTGLWNYNTTNPDASTGNPFSNIPILVFDDYRGISFADLDNDGDIDLTIGVRSNQGSSNRQSFIFVKNQGHGVMTIDRSLDSPVNGVDFGDYAASSVTDYDQDGDLDIVVTAAYDQGTDCTPDGCGTSERKVGKLILRNNDGKYEPLTFALDPFQGVDVPNGNIVFADTDADGDLDAIAPQQYAYTIPLYFENREGEYVQLEGEENPLDFMADEFSRTAMDFHDLDSDGVPDMVLGEADEKLRLYKNIAEPGATPVFEQKPEWETGFVRWLAAKSSPKFIDLDGDGDMDIIVGKYSSIWYYQNIGTATAPVFKEFVDRYYYSSDPDRLMNPFTDISGIKSPAPAMVDIDHDGDKDLLIGDYDGIFTYYENQNPTPTVTPSRTTIEFLPDDTVILDPNIVLTDSDNDQIARIIIKIEPYEPGKEKLDFDDIYTDIEGIWNDSAGELTLTGIASLPDFQSALRSVEYSNTYTQGFERKGSRAAGGRTFTKSVTFLTLDSDLTVSPGNTTAYNITHANDEPVVTPGTFSVVYIDTPVEIIPAITLTDSDDGTLHSAEVSFASGSYISTQDRLQITGSTGVITTAFDGATGVLTLTGVAPIAEYQAVLRAIAYRNEFISGGTPTPRILNVKVYDGESDSNIGQINLSLFGVNAAPVLAPATSSLNYSGSNVPVIPGVTIIDDGSTLASASLTFINGFVTGEDRLLFSAQNGITGTFNDVTGILALSGSASITDYETAIRSVQYTNVATTKTAGDRSLDLVVNDGANSSNTSLIILIVANTPPTITGTANSFWASGEVVINNNVILSDVDNATLESAHVIITGGFNPSEDELLFTAQNGITGSTAPGSNTLILSGTSSVANYQTALRSVRYRNSSPQPSTTDRTFTFIVFDGGSQTTLTGSVIVINKPPVILLQSRKTNSGGNVAFDTGQIFSDPDDNLDLSTLVVTSSQGAGVIIDGGFVTINYGNKANFQGTDEVTFTVCDTGGQCVSNITTIQLSAEPFVYTGMSPNGDGYNDWMHIEFIPEKTQVAVYNRWGDVVFETDDYDPNDPAKRFEGKNKNGTELISGSYFFKVKLPDGKVTTGHVMLIR